MRNFIDPQRVPRDICDVCFYCRQSHKRPANLRTTRIQDGATDAALNFMERRRAKNPPSRETPIQLARKHPSSCPMPPFLMKICMTLRGTLFPALLLAGVITTKGDRLPPSSQLTLERIHDGEEFKEVVYPSGFRGQWSSENLSAGL